MLHKSNGVLTEWLRSDLVYYEEEGFREKVLDLLREHVQLSPLLFHYKNLASNNIKNYLNGQREVDYHNYFYVVRPMVIFLFALLLDILLFFYTQNRTLPVMCKMADAEQPTRRGTSGASPTQDGHAIGRDKGYSGKSEGKDWRMDEQEEGEFLYWFWKACSRCGPMV